jgi:hypothetical protein
MSVLHYIERLSIRRSVPPISFADDDLSIETHRKLQATKLSQIGIEIKPNTPECVTARQKNYYRANREKRYASYRKWVANNQARYHDLAMRYYHKNRAEILEKGRLHYAQMDSEKKAKKIASAKEKQAARVKRLIAEMGYEAYREKTNAYQRELYAKNKRSKK